MKAIKVLILGMALSVIGASAGEGLPLPWPFPWAKECPIAWQSLEGKYALADSSKEEQLQITFHTITRMGFRLVRVARLSSEGELISEGFNFVSANQRTLRLSLFPLDHNQATEIAIIKLYYQSASLSCSEQNLVPIMSVERRGSSTTGTTHYRLIKQEI